MKLTRTSLLSASSLIVGGLIGASTLVAMAAWVPAPTTPPGCPTTTPGCNPPINVGGGTAYLGALFTNGQEKTDSLAIDGNLALFGKLIIPYGASTTNGAVLTTNGAGNVSWSPVGSRIAFMSSPAVVIGSSTNGNTTAWRTVSLTKYGVPATASAVILQARGRVFDDGSNTGAGELIVRATGTTNVYSALYMDTSGNSTAVTISNQGVYPISNGSIDYQVLTGFHSGSASLRLVGYIN